MKWLGERRVYPDGSIFPGTLPLEKTFADRVMDVLQQERMKKGATRIQSVVRGHQARARLREKEAAATQIQSVVRARAQLRKEEAATQIQSVVRGHRARAQLREKEAAATQIQSVVKNEGETEADYCRRLSTLEWLNTWPDPWPFDGEGKKLSWTGSNKVCCEDHNRLIDDYIRKLRSHPEIGILQRMRVFRVWKALVTSDQIMEPVTFADPTDSLPRTRWWYRELVKMKEEKETSVPSGPLQQDHFETAVEPFNTTFADEAWVKRKLGGLLENPSSLPDAILVLDNFDETFDAIAHASESDTEISSPDLRAFRDRQVKLKLIDPSNKDAIEKLAGLVSDTNLKRELANIQSKRNVSSSDAPSLKLDLSGMEVETVTFDQEGNMSCSPDGCEAAVGGLQNTDTLDLEKVPERNRAKVLEAAKGSHRFLVEWSEAASPPAAIQPAWYRDAVPDTDVFSDTSRLRLNDDQQGQVNKFLQVERTVIAGTDPVVSTPSFRFPDGAPEAVHGDLKKVGSLYVFESSAASEGIGFAETYDEALQVPLGSEIDTSDHRWVKVKQGELCFVFHNNLSAHQLLAGVPWSDLWTHTKDRVLSLAIQKMDAAPAARATQSLTVLLFAKAFKASGSAKYNGEVKTGEWWIYGEEYDPSKFDPKPSSVTQTSSEDNYTIFEEFLDKSTDEWNFRRGNKQSFVVDGVEVQRDDYKQIYLTEGLRGKLEHYLCHEAQQKVAAFQANVAMYQACGLVKTVLQIGFNVSDADAIAESPSVHLVE